MPVDVVSIGDFSRMTQLSVKTLRHYHDVGLVEPHHVDPATGYRNAFRLWSLERDLHLPSETALQHLVLHWPALLRSLNAYY
ncbi:MAG: hypothetical protein QOG79_4013, partial [Mycobacterium sp.]|nr:hypothetical protein [Mycobacterium sp.]